MHQKLNHPENGCKARLLLQKAAEAGNAEAMYNLGVLYQTGRGGTWDPTEARRWLQEAAEAGNAEAKEKLSQLPSN